MLLCSVFRIFIASCSLVVSDFDAQWHSPPEGLPPYSHVYQRSWKRCLYSLALFGRLLPRSSGRSYLPEEWPGRVMGKWWRPGPVSQISARIFELKRTFCYHVTIVVPTLLLTQRFSAPQTCFLQAVWPVASWKSESPHATIRWG